MLSMMIVSFDFKVE